MSKRLISILLAILMLTSLCASALADEYASDGDLAADEPVVAALPVPEEAEPAADVPPAEEPAVPSEPAPEEVPAEIPELNDIEEAAAEVMESDSESLEPAAAESMEPAAAEAPAVSAANGSVSAETAMDEPTDEPSEEAAEPEPAEAPAQDGQDEESEITSVSLTVQAPTPGKVTVTNGNPDTQNPHPVVTLPNGVHYKLDDGDGEYLYAYWVKSSTDSTAISGVIAAGSTVFAEIYLAAEDGYKFASDPEITVNGAEYRDYDQFETEYGHLLMIIVSVDVPNSDKMCKVTYDFNGGTVPEGSTFPLSVDFPYGTQFFSGINMTDPGLTPPEYSSGFIGLEIEGEFYPVGFPVNYVITKDVTIKFIYSYYSVVSGDGQTWTKGSSSTADFTVKRVADPEEQVPIEEPDIPMVALADPSMSVDGVNDTNTFELFIGIQIDGADVDASNYTASAGSLILKLKPAYLETLSVGKHTIEFFFEEGQIPATFNIKAASAPPPAPAPTAPVYSPKTADSTDIALWILLFGSCAAGLAVLGRKRRTDR